MDSDDEDHSNATAELPPVVIDNGDKQRTSVNHGEAPTKPPYVIGVVEEGLQVEYRKGDGGQHRSELPYTYSLVNSETKVVKSVIEISPDEYGRPSESMPTVIDRIGDKHGWKRLTDIGCILAYGFVGKATRWPTTVDGGDFIGVVDAGLSVDARHGSAVGLYAIDGSLVPYVIPHDTTEVGSVGSYGHGLPHDPTAVAVPEGPLTATLTVDISEHGDIDDAIRHLEDEDRWHTIGYPHEIDHETTVTGYDVQVIHEYNTCLQYPTYWIDERGNKHEIL